MEEDTFYYKNGSFKNVFEKFSQLSLLWLPWVKHDFCIKLRSRYNAILCRNIWDMDFWPFKILIFFETVLNLIIMLKCTPDVCVQLYEII